LRKSFLRQDDKTERKLNTEKHSFLFEKSKSKETSFSHIGMFVNTSETPFLSVKEIYVSMCLKNLTIC